MRQSNIILQSVLVFILFSLLFSFGHAQEREGKLINDLFEFNTDCIEMNEGDFNQKYSGCSFSFVIHASAVKKHQDSYVVKSNSNINRHDIVDVKYKSFVSFIGEWNIPIKLVSTPNLPAGMYVNSQ